MSFTKHVQYRDQALEDKVMTEAIGSSMKVKVKRQGRGKQEVELELAALQSVTMLCFHSISYPDRLSDLHSFSSFLTVSWRPPIAG